MSDTHSQKQRALEWVILGLSACGLLFITGRTLFLPFPSPELKSAGKSMRIHGSAPAKEPGLAHVARAPTLTGKGTDTKRPQAFVQRPPPRTETGKSQLEPVLVRYPGFEEAGLVFEEQLAHVRVSNRKGSPMSAVIVTFMWVIRYPTQGTRHDRPHVGNLAHWQDESGVLWGRESARTDRNGHLALTLPRQVLMKVYVSIEGSEQVHVGDMYSEETLVLQCLHDIRPEDSAPGDK